MSFQLMVGLCSVIGAALFFAAGYMAARARFSAANTPPGGRSGRSPAAGGRPAAPPSAGGDALAGLFLEAMQTGDRQAAEKDRAKQQQVVQAKLKEASRNIQRLKKDTAILARQKAALETEKKDCRNRLQELAAAETERRQMAAKLGECRKQMDTLKGQNEKLAAELEAARSQSQTSEKDTPSIQALQTKNRDLSLQVRHLSEQLKELERLRQQNQELKSYKGRLKEKDAEIETLKSENAKLNSMKIFWDAPPQPVANLPKEGLGQMFQHMVNRLSESETARGVALADELGLMIAGTSPHAEALAGMAAVFTETRTTLETMLPFGTIDHFSIVNQKGLSLKMRPVTISGHDLILSTLTAGEGPDSADPDRARIEALLKEMAG